MYTSSGKYHTILYMETEIQMTLKPSPPSKLKTTVLSNLGVADFYRFYTKETKTLRSKIAIVYSNAIH